MNGTVRGRERFRRIALSAGASAVSRGIAFAGSLLTIPIVFHHLGPDRFGLWITIISLLVTLNFADLGIGNGLISSLAQAHARGDTPGLVEQVSSALAALTTLALVGILGFLLLGRGVHWGELLNAGTQRGAAEANLAVMILAICLFAGIPASVAQKIHLALQEAFVAHIWSAAGSILGVAGVILSVALDGSLPWLVFAAAGLPTLAALLNSIYLFTLRHPRLRPRMRSVTRDGVKVAARRGLTFLLLGISASVAYQADLIIITRILGADAVSQYAVPLKLFFVAPTVLGFILVPLWPAYAEALASRDLAWVRSALWRSILGGLALTALVSSALLVFGDRIIEIWVGDAIDPSTLLLVGMALWAVVNGIGGPVAMFLNGTDQLRFLVIVAMLMAASNLPLSIFLTHEIGVAGPVFASVITQIAVVLVPSAFFIARLWPRLVIESAPGDPVVPVEEIAAREYRTTP